MTKKKNVYTRNVYKVKKKKKVNSNKLLLKSSESKVSNIWGHFNSTSEPLRADKALFRQLGNRALTTGKSLLWEFLEVQVWLKNKQSLKLEWRKTVQFHNKLDYLEIVLLLQTCQMGKCRCLFVGPLLSSFKQFFLHCYRNKAMYICCELKD